MPFNSIIFKYSVLAGLLSAFSFSCDSNEKFEELPCSYTGTYYYDDEIHSLGQMSDYYILVGSDSTNTDSDIEQFVGTKKYIDKDHEYEIYKIERYPYKYSALKLNRSYSCDEIAWIIQDMNNSSIISYTHYTIKTDSCTNLTGMKIGEKCVISYSNIFNVKIKDADDLTDLNSTLSETQTWIRDLNSFRRDWFSIYSDKNSQGDALEMTSFFYETGLFLATYPDILHLVVEKQMVK